VLLKKMRPEPKILIVEDDAAVRDIVQIALEGEGMAVEAVENGRAALERFRSSHSLDLVVLDVMLPDSNGIDLCRELRSSSNVPIIMLTARDDETSVVVGLEAGADDYVTKPFSPKELVSRVRANLRRQQLNNAHASSAEHKLEFKNLLIDVLRRQVLVREAPVHLTRAEFEILKLLAEHPGLVCSREQIMNRLWDTHSYGGSRSIDTHILHLRQKLEADPKHPRYIHTVRGVGYRFADI
jgi:DNA-binding response OmpR family regulator